jgi:hypothetical protein
MPGWNYNSSHFAQIQQFLRRGEHCTLADESLASWGNLLLLYQKVVVVYVAVALLAVGYIVFFIPP